MFKDTILKYNYDYVGYKYKNYKVLSKTKKRTKHGLTLYNVKCSCGKVYLRNSQQIQKQQSIRKCKCNKPKFETQRNKLLKKKYGITEKDYNKLRKNQSYCCQICGRHEKEFVTRLAVDHNHKTGQIRGLLCSNCNTLIGQCFENLTLLKSMNNYINSYKKK